MVNFNNKKVFEVVVKKLNNINLNSQINTYFINNNNLKKISNKQEIKKIEMHESHSKEPFIKKTQFYKI